MHALKATSIPSIRATLASANAIEAETAINAAGGVAAAVKTHEAWLRSDPGETATDGPWLKFLGSGETKPRPTPRRTPTGPTRRRSEEHTSELQSRFDLVCRLLLEK